MRKRLNLLFAFVLLAAPLGAFAQFTPDPVQYIVTPEVPGPNQQVTIEAQGVGGFIGDATVTWTVNGKVVLSGVGEHSYSFTTGAIGSVTSVHIDIKSPANGTFSKDFVFRPSAVNLVWEADTSAPPLYAGKPLYSAGSPLKVVAFPTVVINGTRVSAASLSYQWSRGGNPVTDASGTGRNTFSFDGDQLQSEEDITVKVYFGASLVAEGGVAIPASQPELALYERDALRGTLYDNALPAGIALSDKEITVQAQPYYFSNSSLQSGALQYSWLLNGGEITGPDSAQGILTLRQTGSGAGSASLSATLQNNASDQLVQSAQTALNILFGQTSSASLFGL